MSQPIIFGPLLTLIFTLSTPGVQAAPQNLSAVFQDSGSTTGAKTKKGSKSRKSTIPGLANLPLPPEYRVYFDAKNAVERAGETGAVEATQHEILSSKADSESRVLEKDLEEYFYALEFKRAEKLSKQKKWKPAYLAFARALGALPPFKWINYWSDQTSTALAAVCTHNKNAPDDLCLLLAKRVLAAFPKGAAETKPLAALPPFEDNTIAEVTGDRLSQTYVEKTDKDEETFTEILAEYLQGHDDDFEKRAKQFLLDYPKSIVRYRSLFLLGEIEFKRNNLKEATAYYQQIMNDIPLSFYAIVASERLKKPMRDLVKRDAVQVDREALNLGPNEKVTLARAETLLQKNHPEEVSYEIDSLARVRSYNTDTLLYLMALATRANQNLSAFRFANEFIQRKYAGLLENDFLSMIFPLRFQQEIQEQASLNNIDPILVTSLMKQESGFKAVATSGSGALGLMQLMPFTAIDVKKDLRLATLREPSVNVPVGTKYIGSLMDKYEGNPVYALAAYNAGPHRVAKWRKEALPTWGMIEFVEAIPYKETREYVMAILRNRYWYQYQKGLPLSSVFSGWKADVRPDPSPIASATPTPVLTPTVTPTPALDSSSSP